MLAASDRKSLSSLATSDTGSNLSCDVSSQASVGDGDSDLNEGVFLMQTGDISDVSSTYTEASTNHGHARIAVYEDDIKWRDEFESNPERVDELISREMMQLSLESRNHIQDEIHGVGCIAPEETPELLKTSLERLRHELKNAIPLAQKRSYLRAKQLYPQSYVHSDDFKLRFLRIDLFDVPRAATRMVYFMDLVTDIYGLYALERPIRLSDFSKHELAEFRKGRLQVLPERDRGGGGTGRRCFCLFPDKEWEEIPPKTRHKIMVYLFWILGQDVDTQRKGVTFLAWMDPNFEPSLKAQMRTRANQLVFVRLSSIHLCSPDTPFYKVRRAMAMMTAGKLRSSLRVHTGKPTELRYSLLGFGFPSDKIPITDTGSIKTTNLKKWMKLRYLEESGIPRKINGKEMRGKTIYSPYLTDVIFRKGKSMSMHPGNIALRHMILSKIERGDFERINKTRKFIKETIDEMKELHANKTKERRNMHPQNPPIRLLIWDEVNKDVWTEIVDDDLLYNKMRHVVKHYHNLLDQETDTHFKKKSMVNQESATSIFLSGDSGNIVPDRFCCFSSSSKRAVKKQKITNDNSGESLECFGKKHDVGTDVNAEESKNPMVVGGLNDV